MSVSASDRPLSWSDWISSLSKPPVTTSSCRRPTSSLIRRSRISSTRSSAGRSEMRSRRWAATTHETQANCIRCDKEIAMMWSRLVSLSVLCLALEISPAVATEQLVIATSPSMRIPVEALGRQFEESHPEIRVRLYFDSGLDIRRTIAAMENTPIGQYFIGKGPIHLIAPGGDELITRLQQRYYVLPDSRYPYATEPLSLIVPESQVD